MASAIEIPGVVFKNGTVTLLARVAGSSGAPLVPSDVSAIRYTIDELDESDPNNETPVAGHAAISLNVADVLLPALERDARWDIDNVGYNFRHLIDVSAQAAFPVAGVYYRVRYELVTSSQTIVARFRLRSV